MEFRRFPIYRSAGYFKLVTHSITRWRLVPPHQPIGSGYPDVLAILSWLPTVPHGGNPHPPERTRVLPPACWLFYINVEDYPLHVPLFQSIPYRPGFGPTTYSKTLSKRKKFFQKKFFPKIHFAITHAFIVERSLSKKLPQNPKTFSWSSRSMILSKRGYIIEKFCTQIEVPY